MPYHLCQSAPLIKSDISRRGADKFGDRVSLHKFGHIHSYESFVIIKHKLGQSFGQFCFAYSGRTEEYKRADRTVRVGDAGAGAFDGIRYFFNGFVLADNAFFQSSSILDNFSASSSSILKTGIPVHLATMFAMSFSVISSFKIRLEL